MSFSLKHLLVTTHVVAVWAWLTRWLMIVPFRSCSDVPYWERLWLSSVTAFLILEIAVYLFLVGFHLMESKG